MFVPCGEQKVSADRRPVWFVFSGMGTLWSHMGRDLMTLDCFRESIMRSDKLLRPYGIELVELLVNSAEETFNDVVSSGVSVVSVQVISHVFDSRRSRSVTVSNRRRRPLVGYIGLRARGRVRGLSP